MPEKTAESKSSIYKRCFDLTLQTDISKGTHTHAHVRSPSFPLNQGYVCKLRCLKGNRGDATAGGKFNWAQLGGESRRPGTLLANGALANDGTATARLLS